MEANLRKQYIMCRFSESLIVGRAIEGTQQPVTGASLALLALNGPAQTKSSIERC